MRNRWRRLFLCSLATLASTIWLDHGALSWNNPQMIGMVAATIIACIAMATHNQKRWLAAVALVCLAPMAQAIYHSLRFLPEIVQYLGIPGVLFIAGSIGTIVTAVHILVVPTPPLPDEHIPSARIP